MTTRQRTTGAPSSAHLIGPEFHVESVPYHLPVTVQWWYEGDHCHVLAGNLETGWIGDSRTPRTATLRLDATLVNIDVPAESCALVEVPP